MDTVDKRERYLKNAAKSGAAIAFCSHLFLPGLLILVLEVLACLLAIGWLANVLAMRQRKGIVIRSLLLLGFTLFMISYHVWSAYRYAMVRAIGTGDIKQIEKLIDEGYDVNASTGGGQNMLTWSFWYPYYGRNKRTSAQRVQITSDEREAKILKMISILVEHGANPNRRDPRGEIPLNRAASEGYIRVCKMLVEKGADVNLAGRFGDRPLHNAVHSGDPQVVTMLIERGADIALTGERGLTPMQLAVETGRQNIIDLLKRQGAGETMDSGAVEKPPNSL